MSLEAAILAQAMQNGLTNWSKYKVRSGLAVLATPTTSPQTTFSYTGSGFIKGLIMTAANGTATNTYWQGFGTITVDGVEVFAGNYTTYSNSSGPLVYGAGIVEGELTSVSTHGSGSNNTTYWSPYNLSTIGPTTSMLSGLASSYPYTETPATAAPPSWPSSQGVAILLPCPLFFQQSVTVQQQYAGASGSQTGQHQLAYVLGTTT